VHVPGVFFLAQRIGDERDAGPADRRRQVFDSDLGDEREIRMRVEQQSAGEITRTHQAGNAGGALGCRARAHTERKCRKNQCQREECAAAAAAQR
jgi:hypothetical protein